MSQRLAGKKAPLSFAGLYLTAAGEQETQKDQWLGDVAKNRQNSWFKFHSADESWFKSSIFWLLTKLIGTMGTMWGIRAATTWFSTWRARNLPPQAGGDPSDRKWICSILGAPKRQALQREHLFRNWYFGTAPNFCTLRWLVSNAERWYHLWLFGCLEMSVVCQNRRRTDLHVRLLVPE